MMEKNPIQNDARRVRRTRRAKDTEMCITCWATYAKTDVIQLTMPDTQALIRVVDTFPPAVWRRYFPGLQENHLLARVNDPTFTVWQCKACHAEWTGLQRDMGIDWHRDSPNRTFLDWLLDILASLQAFCYKLGDSLGIAVEQLRAFIRGLDRDAPQWRAMPEARKWPRSIAPSGSAPTPSSSSRRRSSRMK
jgi:hypothetical protein